MTSKTVYNFGAGPAMLPQEVMQQVKDELLDWNGTGISVIEMSHRSKEFISITEEAEANLRKFWQSRIIIKFSMCPVAQP